MPLPLILHLIFQEAGISSWNFEPRIVEASVRVLTKPRLVISSFLFPANNFQFIPLFHHCHHDWMFFFLYSKHQIFRKLKERFIFLPLRFSIYISRYLFIKHIHFGEINFFKKKKKLLVGFILLHSFLFHSKSVENCG